jgi:predicted DNA-binding transcriptional regulator AlpA
MYDEKSAARDAGAERALGSRVSVNDLLTPHQVAAYLGLAYATLQRQRTEATGPKFIKLGKRKIAYRAVDLAAWLATRVAASTADARVRGLTA